MWGWVSWLKPVPCFGKLTVIKMNTNQIGKITELEVLLYIQKLGYSVSIPFGDKDRYDQIWDIDGRLLRIQVKTSHWTDEEHTCIEFKCESSSLRGSGTKNLKYSKTEIDYFATYWEGKCYLVPVEECSTKKKLRFKAPKTNISTCNFAKDYEVEEVLKRL